MQRRAKSGWVGLGLVCALSALPQPAAAFCGFYVAGADTHLYANATMVVMMRDGTRTVLSIQNNYQGPPEAFAMVVPVPTVLQQDQVKVLPKDVFTHVDALGAPRLVEYWEGDPCQVLRGEDDSANAGPTATRASSGAPGAGSVKVEAMFAVGEYDIVILSTKDSSGLETWLHDNKYNIPNGAAEVLDPYVAAGTKFFVAKVDPQRVSFQDGQAALSPLRFHYDTQDFNLPVRLGLLNSQGTQDLIVNILASDRYEVANHANVTIPTNIRVQNDVRNAFGGFYEALFAQTVAKNPGAVVTEYSWAASTCDPCPTQPLSQSDLATLGADVTQSVAGGSAQNFVNYTLTRLHYRYTKETLGDDLVFKQAPPLMGGRGVPDDKGMLESTNDTNAGVNNFQGRYVILHAWDKAITCQTPVRGRWGEQSGQGSAPPGTMTATNTALVGKPAARAADLSALVAESVPSIGVTAKSPSDPLANGKSSGGCSLTSAHAQRAWPALLLGLGAIGFAWRKRRR
jgi:hypothetical protein